MAKTRSNSRKSKEKSEVETSNSNKNSSKWATTGRTISMTDESSALKRHTKHSLNGAGSKSGGMDSLQERIRQKEERQELVLWKHPITTLSYFVLEMGYLTRIYLKKLWSNKRLLLGLLILTLMYYGLKLSDGPHQKYLSLISVQMVWCGWWLWLGVLSSVGLGTGLHTFLLYLGPHIASVTMAGYTCNSLDFPEPPYPEEIVCPTDGSTSVISLWTIMSKVRLEAFMWGAGTALGELPPYFMARGARLSGYDPDDEEMAEYEELQRLKEKPEDMGWLDRAKLSVENLVEKVGFVGILACASIPNPLFDLAGITCGHFLVPFWTFFGATLIGKAVVKMHIQKLFVIIAFNESLLQSLLSIVGSLPLAGSFLQKLFQDFLLSQQTKLKRKPGENRADAKEGPNILSWVFEKLILLMVVYFVVSIVHSLAQSYHKRTHKTNTKSSKLKKKARD